MIIDQAGSLQRFVRLDFLEPSTDPALDESAYPGFPVDPLSGGTGTLLTSRIPITTWGVLKEDDQGILKRDPDYPPLDMDKMQTGESKYILMGIDFNPAGESSTGLIIWGSWQAFCKPARPNSLRRGGPGLGDPPLHRGVRQ